MPRNADREQSVYEAITDRWVDGEGGYRVGREHGFSVADIRNDVGVSPELDRQIQVEINQALKRFNHTHDVLSGGSSSRPVLYFIAGSEDEETELIDRYAGFTRRHLDRLVDRMGLADTPAIQGAKVSMIAFAHGFVAALAQIKSSNDQPQLPFDGDAA